MGGLPSTVMLRHSDTTIDPITKARAHEFLAQQVKQPAPTPVDEANDPAKADHFYTACGNWLRENTRDHDKFNILFEENISYGFHRNLLGLRTIAFVLDGLVIAICVVWLWFRRPFSINDRLTLTLSAIICLTAVQGVYLGLWIAPQGAIDAAHRYGRQLILSFEKF
jgi:hypothetical protein